MVLHSRFELQRNGAAGFDVALAPGHAAAQAELLDGNLVIALAGADHALQRAGQVHALIAPLAQPRGIGVGIESGQVQLRLAQSAPRQKVSRSTPDRFS